MTNHPARKRFLKSVSSIELPDDWNFENRSIYTESPNIHRDESSKRLVVSVHFKSIDEENSRTKLMTAVQSETTEEVKFDLRREYEFKNPSEAAEGLVDSVIPNIESDEGL